MNYVVTDPSMRRKIERWIRENDFCYTFDDVMQMIGDGRYQTHLFGQTWVLTSIHEFPQRKSVHIDLVIGHLVDAIQAEPEICDWARSIGANMITGSGRPGWDPLRDRVKGWRFKGYHYSKEL
jgi:hypothetical protein